MPISPHGGILLLLILLSTGVAHAEVVTLNPVADTSLFELDPDVNFGRQRDLPAGVLGLMGDSSRARVLYRFDLAGAVPDGAVIDSACMTLSITSQIPETGRRVSDFALSRVLVDWGEGDGFGERPGGRDAEPGEATWNYRFHPEVGLPDTGAPWSEPGGVFGIDYATEQSAMTRNVDGSEIDPTSYRFDFNQIGLADLQTMIDGAAPNFGWVLYTLSETTRKTARRWTSREVINEGPPPQLEIAYSLPAPEALELTSVGIDEVTQEFYVSLNGLLGYRYELECADNLANWQSGEVQVPTEDGELVFRISLEGATKFVRVRRERLAEEGNP